MPAGVAWNLRKIKAAALEPREALTWKAKDGREEESAAATDLLGSAPFSILKPGAWCARIDLPAARPVLVFAVRCDKSAAFQVGNARLPEEKIIGYRWAWQLFLVSLRPESRSARLCLTTTGVAEVIGPLLLPADFLVPLPICARSHVLPLGVLPLDIRGSE